MILDTSCEGLGSLAIDSDLQSIAVVDNREKLLRTFELRKFKTLYEYKLT